MPGPSIGYGAPPVGRSPVGVLSQHPTLQGILLRGPYAQAVIADLPVMYLRLGEGSGLPQDIVGTNHVSSITGAPTYGIPGALVGDPDTAMSFVDDATDLLTVPDATPLDVGDVFSIEFILKLSAAGTAQYYTQKGATGGDSFAVYKNTNGLIIFAPFSTGVSMAHSKVAITDTAYWHHVVVTKNGSARFIYIDGVDVTGLDANVTLTNTTDPLKMSAKGGLDEFALYNYDLTPGRVTAHFVASGIVAHGIGTTLTSLALDSVTTGRKIGRGSVATSQSLDAAATGRKIGRGTVLTDTALTSAVTGRKTGRGAVATSWAFDLATTGRKIGKGTVASSLAFAPVTTGRKIGRGAVLTSWIFESATTGHTHISGTSLTSLAFTSSVTGRKIGKGAVATSQAFDPATTGRKIGRGSIVTSQAFASIVTSRAGVRAGTTLTSWAFTSVTTGRKLGRGAVGTSWAFSPATIGRKLTRGTVATSQAFTSAIDSRSLPTGGQGSVGFAPGGRIVVSSPAGSVRTLTPAGSVRTLSPSGRVVVAVPSGSVSED